MEVNIRWATPMAATTYRPAITDGDKVAVIQASSGGSLYPHPVE
jgi:hypothetical protein